MRRVACQHAVLCPPPALRWVLTSAVHALGYCRDKKIYADECYFCSLSSRTIVYKGQLTPEQVHRDSIHRGGNMVSCALGEGICLLQALLRSVRVIHKSG